MEGNGKTPSSDVVYMKTELTQLFNNICKTGIIPTVWLRSILLPYKKKTKAKHYEE